MLKNESIIVKNEKIHVDTKGNEGFLASTSGTHVSASLQLQKKEGTYNNMNPTLCGNKGCLVPIGWNFDKSLPLQKGKDSHQCEFWQ